MPRLSKGRTAGREELVAQRIEQLRTAAGMTYEGLAKRVTEAGCPLAPSAIYKIERAEPRRRITVDELVAFAEVFGVSVEELTRGPEHPFFVQLEALNRELVDSFSRLTALQADAQEMQDRLRATITFSSDLRQRIEGLFQQRQELVAEMHDAGLHSRRVDDRLEQMFRVTTEQVDEMFDSLGGK